jgi:cyclopropane fatty-acyl-phospholipid synthase-like methyltransferase
MSKVELITEFPVAWKSPDHLVPTGTKNDNNTNTGYIEEVENLFNKQKINVMDLGCAGGQLIVDFANRGHLAVGVEGSDYNIKHQLHNWPEYHKKVLFTADLTKPYKVLDENGEQVKFDLISAWEVIEHISWSNLDIFFENMFSNLKDDGIFVGSINTGPDIREENGKLIFLHQTVFPEEFWKTHILNKYLVEAYPFKNRVRTMQEYFLISIKRK